MTDRKWPSYPHSSDGEPASDDDDDNENEAGGDGRAGADDVTAPTDDALTEDSGGRIATTTEAALSSASFVTPFDSIQHLSFITPPPQCQPETESGVQKLSLLERKNASAAGSRRSGSTRFLINEANEELLRISRRSSFHVEDAA